MLTDEINRLIQTIKDYEPFGKIRENNEVWKIFNHEKVREHFTEEFIEYSKVLYNELVNRYYADCYILNQNSIDIIIESIENNHKATPSRAEQMGSMLLSHQLVEALMFFLVNSMRVHLQASFYPRMISFSEINVGNRNNGIINYCSKLEEFWFHELFDYLEIRNIINLAKKINAERNKLAHSFFQGKDMTGILGNYYNQFENFIKVFFDLLKALDCSISIKWFEQELIDSFENGSLFD